ncbi:MAG: cadherin-like beta sandwich domain-containing protein, partial [Daejeonella sp.]|nr:cadherin-like beta sandwich domain-containing protein [Daejeonella sp.]
VGTNVGNGAAGQGFSIALSADGNTAISGGINDNGLAGVGGAWIFSRTGNAWTQQTKLVGTGASGLSAQGHSVSLSADGNTAAVGGVFDDLSQGATWLFKRDGSTWTQQGSKLKGTGMANEATQGFSVALSADGKMLITGGPSDDVGLGASWIFTAPILSDDANLSALSLSSGTLSPGFSAATLAYSASVLNSTASVTVTPTRAQANATIEVRVNGGSFAAVGSGTASNALALNVGINTIDVKVTAQDGSTTRSYTLTLTRANPVPVISSLTPATILAGTSAVITVNGLNFGGSTSDLTSLTYGPNGTEQAGSNMVWVSSTQIQFTTAALTAGTSYKVTLTVSGQASAVSSSSFTAVSNNADLSALSLSSGTLSPGFSSATLAYSASVSNSTESITVTPTRAQANATIEVRVNGGSFAALGSGTASKALALNVGINTIDVKVTAQDGSTTKTYQITLTRLLSAIADLSAYEVIHQAPTITFNGFLRPDFNSSTIAYTDTVVNSVTDYGIRPTAAQANATIKVNGATVASRATSAPIALTVGETVITTVVTAQDGITTKTYTIKVHRKGVPTLSV